MCDDAKLVDDPAALSLSMGANKGKPKQFVWICLVAFGDLGLGVTQDCTHIHCGRFQPVPASCSVCILSNISQMQLFEGG